uniref:Uncharacterized protein n=1 Tax=Arundo donax TaxID=35708 RepID=A0A0A8ZYX7_ARUDO
MMLSSPYNRQMSRTPEKRQNWNSEQIL